MVVCWIGRRSIFLFLPFLFNAVPVLCYQFVQEAEAIGLEHVHIEPKLIGGGVGVFDYDNDGYEDLYLTGGTRQDWVFRNNRNGGFERVLLDEITLATRTVNTVGVTTGDINNDGYDDVFVTTDSKSPNILLLNLGNGHFQDISETSGIHHLAWSTSASFLDYNGDGLLDIYIANYVREPKVVLNDKNEVVGFAHDCYTDFLYMNEGGLTFKEVSAGIGIAEGGCGLAVAATDVDGDQLPDIFVANDFGDWVYPNLLYTYSHSTNLFSERSADFNLNQPFFGMGIANGDFNGDGLKDYYVSNIGVNGLFEQQSHGFVRSEDKAGVAHEKYEFSNSTSWGALFFDFDNDGDEDLAIANGMIGSASFLEVSQFDPNVVYENDREYFSLYDGFSDVQIEQRSRGVVAFDPDLDGDLDLLFTNVVTLTPSQGNVQFFRNQSSVSSNWIQISLEGETVNKNGWGANVYLYKDGFLSTKELMNGGTHLSNSSKRLHFGLGDINELDSVVVKWPGGSSQAVSVPVLNQRVLIREGVQTAEVLGCTLKSASNYNEKATVDDGTCEVITSLVSEKKVSKLRVSPNPTTESVFINVEENSVLPQVFIITDTQGRTVNTISTLGNPVRPLEIKMPQNPGVYILKGVYSSAEVISEKVIVRR